MANFLSNTLSNVEETLGLNPQTKDILVNSQIPIFRGYGKDGNLELGNNNNLALEDPSFIVFDVNIDPASTLFTDVKYFLNKYGQYDSEIRDASFLYDEFIKTLKLIFPLFSSKNIESGSKRHYINAINGLDNLNKPMINYPEDKIIFKLSEDITMLVQYLSELYSNLTYSFSTNRQLIPSNLLLFNMYIILSDVRDMEKGLKKVGSNYAHEISEDKSKFIYILHDCELNFFSSKLHGDEVVVGGYSSGPTTTPSTVNINMNFKSYSRILSSSLIDGAYLLDYRLKTQGFDEDSGKPKILTDGGSFYTNGGSTRSKVYDDFYSNFNNDYKTQEEFEKNNKIRYNVAGIDPTSPPMNPQGYFNKLSNTTSNQLKGLGSSMINKLKSEVDILKGTVQEGIGTALGVNLTLTKINVYFDTPEDKLNRFSLLASNIADNITHNLNKTVENGLKDVGDKINGNGDYNRLKNTNLGSMANDIRKDALNGLTSVISGKGNIGEIGSNNIYGRDDADYLRSGNGINNGKDDNDKLPSRGSNDTYTVGNNELYYIDNNPSDIYKSNLYEDQNTSLYKYEDINGKTVTVFNHYNEKNPDDENIYGRKANQDYLRSGKGMNRMSDDNDKKPVGDLNPNGTYNQKIPDGDLQPNGTYNQKYPDGNLQSNGTYNEKYPDGNREENGTYNQKTPDGDLQPNGTYNQKYPDGSREENGTYNQKLPSGDLQPNGSYNEKYPNGSRESNGDYNQKYPSGTRESNGSYNEKYPDGSRESNGSYNEKYPDGSRESNGTYNQKLPSGTRESNGDYNQKYPDGERYIKPIYNRKKPTDKNIYVSNEQYNINFNNNEINNVYIDKTGQYKMNFENSDSIDENVYLKNNKRNK